MKNTSIKRLLACVLALTVVAGMLAGCGDSGSGKETTKAQQQSTEAPGTTAGSEQTEAGTTEEVKTGVTYPVEGDVTLTFAMQERAAILNAYDSMGDAPFIKAWQEATGIKLEVQQYASVDALNLMMVGGDLPDIIFMNFNSYPGGIAKAIQDKVVLPLNDYMEYAPDLQAVLESDEVYRKSNTTPDGDVCGFPFIRGDEYLKTSMGLIIRQDFLDQVKMEVPNTPDELYEVLKAFRDELKLEVPMSIKSSDILIYGLQEGILTSPFGLPKSEVYVKDDVVHAGYYEKEYKDVLAWLHKLYDEGLLDKNFTTKPDTRAHLMNGVCGVTMDTPGGGIGTMLSTMADDPNFDVTGFGPLVAKEGDTPMSTHYDNAFTGQYAVITTDCENVEAAMKFLNYGYTEAGMMLFNFGIEGESYEMINGYPTYTDMIMKNPEGLTVSNAMAPYVAVAVIGAPTVQERRYMEQYSGLPQQQQAIDQWSNSNAAKYQLPQTTISADDQSEYSKLSSDIWTYVAEMTSKYITGLKDLNDFESEYLATLKSMGVERLLELEQKAYDEFNAR